MSLHRADLDHVEVGESGMATGKSGVALATVGGRLLARVIDGVAIGGPGALASLLIWPDGGLLVMAAVIAVVGIVYDTALVTQRGTTPGKHLLRLDIVDVATGSSPTLRTAGLRALGFWAIPASVVLVEWFVLPSGSLSLLIIAVTILAAVLSPLFDERMRRGVADQLASTVVVLRPQEPMV